MNDEHPPFSGFDLRASEVDTITSFFDILAKRFKVSYEVSFLYDFDTLEIFSNRTIQIGPAIRIANNTQSFHMVFLRVEYSYSYGRKILSSPLTHEYQTWGIMTLKKDFGHILIKPETLLDKIHELINPVEIKFSDDPEFSKHFYIVTDNETKAKAGLTQSFRRQLEQLSIRDFIIEIRNNRLIIGTRRIIETQTSLAFANFMNGLCAL